MKTSIAPTPAQKRYFIALVENLFPCEQTRNFYYKMMKGLTKAEVSYEVQKLRSRLARIQKTLR